MEFLKCAKHLAGEKCGTDVRFQSDLRKGCPKMVATQKAM